MSTAEPVSPEQAESYYNSLQESSQAISLLSVPAFVPMSATTVSPEISELARALRNDPKLIYDYVHNHIDYVPYFGSLKGATLTYLDSSGNDFDQASLMIALLRASGYTAQYIHGRMTIPGINAANWLGVDVAEVGSVIASGGIPVTPYTDGSVRLERVWVKATIGGVDYLFDPAFKTYSYNAKIDLAAALGYTQADFLTGATTGATVGVDYIQYMSEENLKSQLATYAANLATTIRSQHPNKTVEEIVGGRSIDQTNLAQYATTLPFSPTVISIWDDIPANRTTTIRIVHKGIDYTANIPDLSGKRLTLTYAGTDNHPELRLDGTLLFSGTATTLGSRNNCTITINHPYAANSGTYQDQTVIYKPESGSDYAIVYSFGGVSDTLLSKLQLQLDRYRAQGFADNTEEVRGETLHLMGMSWLKQVSQSMNLLAAITETVPVMHHNIGLMAQETGYYIDVQAAKSSIVSRHNIVADMIANFKGASLIGSAFEHGILEQLAGSDKPGVSTMKLFQIANATGRKVFLASSANYDVIRPQLVNYSDTELNDFYSQVNSQNRILILPDNGQLTLDQWRGKGYISKYFSESSWSMGMIIGGGYYGGYAATQGTVSTPTVSQKTKTAQVTAPSPATVNRNISTTPPSKSKDPVDMAGGSFLFDHTDLTLGSVAPLGLAFSRSYTSANAMNSGTMGNGWSHNYDIHLTPTSHGEPGLGLRQPVDAASLVAALYVSTDLLKTNDDITAWMSASLASKWAVDQVIDNAMVLHLGNKSIEFVKLADGTYAAPPGITSQLIKNGDGTFSLVERFGTRIDFNSNMQASRLTDIDGNILTFTYNGANNLATVQDAFNRTLTLGYDTNLRVNSVTDSTGRQISYGYNANNDLATYTDPENKSWTYGYDTSHRMTTITNPLAIITATNAYDTLGRVMTQTVPREGIPATATYNFYFSGFRNVEEDPAGNTTTYYYDKKGREYATENALGQKSSRQFDGQDHTIQTTDPRMNTTTFLYDGNHNLTQITDALGKNTVFTYDPLLYRLTDKTDPLGHLFHTDYDAEHHPVQTIVWPTPGTAINTAKTYYANGLSATATDGRGFISNFTYDAYGNPDRAWVGTHPQVDYDYDARGWLTKVIDQENVNTAEQAHTYFEYDNRGLVTLKRTPISKTVPKDTVYTYYDDGSIWTKTDRNSDTTTYTYTPSGNFRTITYQDNSSVVFNYNSLDKITSIKNYAPNGSLVNETLYTAYDAAGRLLSVTDPYDFVVSYAYNEAGNIKEITYPSSDSVERKLIYRYDELNRLQYVDNWLSQTAQYVYDGAGRLDHVINFNGTKTFYGYDNANRMTSLENVQSDGTTVIASYNYPVLDGNGNRNRIDEIAPISQTLTAQTTSYTYNDVKNRLVSAGSTIFTLDDEGQITAKGSTTYAFDYEHRLTGVNGADAIQYTYDALGNRFEKTVNGQVTRYIYDQLGNLLAEADSSNSILRYYIHGKGLLAMATPGGASYCYHFDGSGNTVAMTNNAAAIVNAYAYEPFGVINNQSETIPHSFKFAGQVGIMAEPNGFYYMRARYYDPEVGRFVSEDPSGFGGGSLNLYAYVGNNPGSFVFKLKASG